MHAGRPFAILLCAVTCVGALSAQGRPRVEVGGYGAWFQPDASVSGGGGLGAGAWVTVPVWGPFAANVDVGVNGAGDGVTATVPAVAVLLGPRPGSGGPFVGLGYARPSFSRSPAPTVAEDAVLALLGLRFVLSPRLAMRVEVRGFFAPGSELANATAAHGAATVGLSFTTGGRIGGDLDGDGVVDDRDRCADTPPNTVVDGSGCPRDADGDGVPNGIDACPHTPPGTLITADGCPLDEDGDLVYDGLDQCPGTPAGAPVDRRGCPADADGDGVYDGVDRCPGTPARAQVDPVGCPRDSDGDGVWDGHDRCPDTPRGVRVAPDGCPATPPPIEITFTPERSSVELRGVTFESGRSRLLPSSNEVLDEVARVLLANPDWRIEVAGYTDNTGSAATNRRLSLARAEAVRAYLVERGVPAGRLTAQGYGPANPVAPNTTADGRARNRRVEIRKLD